MQNKKPNLESIFLGAMECNSPEERRAFLQQQCQGDEDLLGQVEELLSANAEMNSFLLPDTQCQLVETEVPNIIGTSVGPYKLMEQIGEGGMGIVYVADQSKPVKRRVALKIIKPGMATREVLARFEQERQALAMMEHPNIAKVLDAGWTESGHSYFVMELVHGITITEYCDSRKLPISERLELFLDLCSAVQHAHQKGIIHRDIKPANVLVSTQNDRAVVKVIDFGIAKAVGQRLAEQTIYTHMNQIIGTPIYMSPEQADFGLDIDTRSDIYSLGILLYELLTGCTPYEKERFRTVVPDELRRIIREELPLKPSAKVSRLRASETSISENRSTSKQKLRQSLLNDVDWIVMKALEKDRTRRYETANALALDVERYLACQPVRARPPSLVYRTRVFCRRNRRVLWASMALLLLTAIVGQWVSYRTSARTASNKVDALRSTDMDKIYNLVEEIDALRWWADPRLHREFADNANNDEQRVRIAIALVPVDESKIDYLYERLLDSSPGDFVAIRRSLVPYRNQLLERLWQVARDPAANSDRRFAAACALAEYDPANESAWSSVSEFVANTLVAKNTLRAAAWAKTLEPVQAHLIAPLGDIYRCSVEDRSPTEIDLATILLEQWVSNEADALAELIFDAKPNQFETLFDEFQSLGKEQAIAKIRTELDRQPKYSWNDKPVDSRWGNLTSVAINQIKNAKGMLNSHFAFCQALPSERFCELSEDLRVAGYRLVRLRPYQHDAKTLIAASWRRDGKTSQYVLGKTANEILQSDSEMQNSGYSPIDVAGFIQTDQDEAIDGFAAVWEKSSDEPGQFGIFVGATSEHFGDLDRKTRWQSGFTARRCLHAYLSSSGKTLYSGISGPSDVDFSSTESRNLTEPEFSSIEYFDKICWDLAVHEDTSAENQTPKNQANQNSPSTRFANDQQLRLAAVWHLSHEFESQTRHGLTFDEHLEHCQELEVRGYRIFSISAASINDQVLTASIWHRPVVSIKAKDLLARRQANAAVAAYKLGAVELVWPLLKHSSDPSLRSMIIHRLVEQDASPIPLVNRLAIETDVSIRRAIILTLGEYDEHHKIDRAALADELLNLYEHDVDSGIHGAVDWVLRKWFGSDEHLKKAKQRLATGKFEGARNWYITQTNHHTMSAIHGPIKFLMGTSSYDRAHYAFNTCLHQVLIDRGFAISSKEVTIDQFKEFLLDTKIKHLYKRKHAPSSDCPQISVTWFEAAKYCRWLSEKENVHPDQMCYPPINQIKPGMKLPKDYLRRTGYRLPTEAEWEYACRAGSLTARPYGQSVELFGKYAWIQTKWEEVPHCSPVGVFKPNDFGLFDMLGNIVEWSQDRFTNQFELGSLRHDVEDPTLVGEYKFALRGMSYRGAPANKHSGARSNALHPSSTSHLTGFRIVRTIQSSR